MKIAFIILFSIIILKGNYVNVFCQKTFEEYSSKDTLLCDAKKIINEFDMFMREKGFTPPYIPSIEISTSYALIYWNEAKNRVVLPYWDKLYPEQKKLFIGWRGENAEEFFISLFNWFFIPHELGHFMLLTNPHNNLTPYESERAANEFAIAFLISKRENQEKIKFIEKSLQEVLDILPIIDFENMTEEEYFNVNYSKLGTNPNAYGYFQFKFILDILKTKDNININSYLSNDK